MLTFYSFDFLCRGLLSRWLCTIWLFACWLFIHLTFLLFTFIYLTFCRMTFCPSTFSHFGFLHFLPFIFRLLASSTFYPLVLRPLTFCPFTTYLSTFYPGTDMHTSDHCFDTTHLQKRFDVELSDQIWLNNFMLHRITQAISKWCTMTKSPSNRYFWIVRNAIKNQMSYDEKLMHLTKA